MSIELIYKAQRQKEQKQLTLRLENPRATEPAVFTEDGRYVTRVTPYIWIGLDWIRYARMFSFGIAVNPDPQL